MSKREIWVAAYPDTIGGAATESLHALKLLRDHGVEVHLVPFHRLMSNVLLWCSYVNIHVHHYEPDIFKDKIVATWACEDFLRRLPQIAHYGKPRCTIHFSCMTALNSLEISANAHGLIDRWGFVSHYQRYMLRPTIEVHAPHFAEFEGYKPYFDPSHRAQRIEFRYREPLTDFVIGRISRDDPSKFSSDTWLIFEQIKTGAYRKVVRVMGHGPKCAAAIATPRRQPGAQSIYELLPPGAMDANDFYGGLHCLLHKTGGSRESYGRFVVEAACAGVPVIAENNYAFPELIIDRETGFLCTTPESFEQTATMLANDERERKRIICNAYQHAIKNLISRDDCWAAWERLLNEAG